MKIAILGGAGLRTPLLLQAFLSRQSRLGLREVALMDIDAERLELIAALVQPIARQASWTLSATTDARAALAGADFVITTFRVGGMEARVVDERVPLAHGVLGQETTGPGGLSMALRAIPVLRDYLRLMAELCPQAWLVNFANPSGMLTEAARRVFGWERAVGICDAPRGIQEAAAAALGVPSSEVHLDYFGLNHLGWVRAVWHAGRDRLPELLAMLRQIGRFPGFPFDAEFVAGLGLIPNEYLYYYYHTAQAVEGIRRAGRTRGEEVLALNTRFLESLRRLRVLGDTEGMAAAYQAYLEERGATYMAHETGLEPGLPDVLEAATAGGYGGVALDLIEALAGGQPRVMVLNVPNGGAIAAMGPQDVVEVPTAVARGFLWPLSVGAIPDHCLGLMKQVKECERLTIAAAVEGSRDLALRALALHPLVPDLETARAILDEYQEAHGDLFPWRP